MTEFHFPNPDSADQDGIVCFSDRINSDLLIRAYSKGIFPWPIEGIPLTPWFSPDPRAILRYPDFKTNRSLSKKIRAFRGSLTFNRDFKLVIDTCAGITRKGQHGTWITPEIISAYSELNKNGLALSAELRNENEGIIAGIYGVTVNGIFSAESMFHHEPNSGKILLYLLLNHFDNQNLSWIDVQVSSPHLSSLGAIDIKRKDFIALIASSKDPNRKLLA